MKNKIFGLLIISIVLSACVPERAIISTNTIAPSAESPIPSVVPIPFPTPSADTPRWVLYERALSYIFLGPPEKTLPDMSLDHGLCEWEIWGQNEKEVYIYALCQANNEIGTATSAPAVIRLGEDGTILEIEMPDEGFGNLKELFPREVLARILNNKFPADKAWDRIQRRRKDTSIVPLIVEQGEILP